MKHLLRTMLLFSLGIPAPTNSACFCVIPEVPEAFAQADAVFVGEVIEIVEPKASDEKAPLTDHFYTIRFKVRKTFKGAPFAERTTLSAQGKIGCFAYPAVSKGERYLVYGDPAFENDVRLKGVLMISSCNRTALLPLPGLRLVSRLNLSDYNQRDGYEDLKRLEGSSLWASPKSTF
jgi:hypothetical protein